MTQQPEDEEREERIAMEIIVDAYGSNLKEVTIVFGASCLSERRDEKWSPVHPTIHLLAHLLDEPHGLMIRTWHAHRDKQERVAARKEDMLF